MGIGLVIVIVFLCENEVKQNADTEREIDISCIKHWSVLKINKISYSLIKHPIDQVANRASHK
jgi:hypothetical protein